MVFSRSSVLQKLLEKTCEELSGIRRKNATVLTQKLKDALIGLLP